MKVLVSKIHSVFNLWVNLSILIAISVFTSCNSDFTRILLQERTLPEPEVIDYSGSIYHGNFINVIRGSERSKVRYKIEVDDNGKVLHVDKCENKYYEQPTKNLDMFRSLHLLVTDTSRNDPTFFGYPVSGYYTNTYVINDVINAPNPKTVLYSLSQDEKEMFRRIDSLAGEKGIKFNGVDTTNVLGWFKYVF